MKGEAGPWPKGHEQAGGLFRQKEEKATWKFAHANNVQGAGRRNTLCPENNTKSIPTEQIKCN